MGVFRTRPFALFARKSKLTDEMLLKAAQEVADGNFEADLGGGLFKKRAAREGGGKSGGFRTIVVFKPGRHSFFVHGFAKSDKANVSAREKRALRLLAREYLALSSDELKAALEAGALIEVVVNDGDEN